MSNEVERVRAEMERRNLSARKLARQLGLKPDTVLDYINQRRPTRRSTRVLIARELGLILDSEAMSA